MSEEKMRILKMVQEGKVSPEEGAELLDALNDTSIQEVSSSSKSNSKVLKVRIREGEKTRVNVTIPLALAKLGMKFIPTDAKATLEDRDIDLDQILKAIEDEVPGGKIVDIEDDDGNTKVEVTIE